MRLLISFLLTIFIYISFIGLFFYFIISNNKVKKVKEVYIHQAIIIDKSKKNISTKIENKEKLEEKKVASEEENIKKEIQTKKDNIEKSKDTFSKGGKDIKFDDIFANTPDNIPTEKVVQKKQKNMTKQKGDEEFSKLVKKELSNLNNSFKISSNSDEKSKSYISNEFEKIWAKLNTQDGDFVTLVVDVSYGKLNIIVISTNLDTIILNKFLNKLKHIDISKIKQFHGKIIFNTKLKGN